jgi:hypothetical protein
MSIKGLLRTLAAGVIGAAATFSHAALLNLEVQDPTVDVAAGGVIAYNAAARVVTISGTPLLLQQLLPTFIFAEFMGTGTDDEKLFTIQFKVDASGNFVSGVDGPDLIIKGSVDTDFDGVADFDGVLLEAEVSAFGFQNGAAGANDRFDMRLDPTGGLLAHLFAGRDLALVVDGEPSPDYPNPFGGSWAADFVGLAKTVLGSIDPAVSLPCTLKVDTFCSVDGGPKKQVCRIQVTKSPKHWEHVHHSCGGRNFRVFKYGMHGNSTPSWASRYASTPVKFTYEVTNTGTTPISNLQVIDSFDVDVTGVPAMLAPGQKVTLMRTEQLREGLVNSVIATGESGAQMCMSKDSVAVKDKVRKKRQHDDDKYHDKRARGDRDD